MNVRDFLDVRVICEAGSLRKAAAVLGVTQPTLSNRIAHLEDQLGSALFDRSRGQSRPTDLALFIASRAAGMSGEASRLTSEVKRLSSGKCGIVRVGVSPGPSYIAANMVIAVSGRWPEIGLDVLTAPSAQLVMALVERQIDMLVSPEIDVRHPAVASELLVESELIAVAHPEHPMCADPPDDVAGLFAYPIALPIPERHYLDAASRQFGIDIEYLPGRILCSDPATLACVARRSPRHFAAGPRFYFAKDIESGTLRVIDTRVPVLHRMFLHHNREAYPLPAALKVRDIVRETFTAAAGGESGRPGRS